MNIIRYLSVALLISTLPTYSLRSSIFNKMDELFAQMEQQMEASFNEMRYIPMHKKKKDLSTISIDDQKDKVMVTINNVPISRDEVEAEFQDQGQRGQSLHIKTAGIEQTIRLYDRTVAVQLQATQQHEENTDKQQMRQFDSYVTSTVQSVSGNLDLEQAQVIVDKEAGEIRVIIPTQEKQVKSIAVTIK